MKPTPEHLAIAAEIAARFNEGERPRKQIERMLDVMGEKFVNVALSQAALGELGVLFGTRRDGTVRTSGGVFFAVARCLGAAAVVAGAITRRQFFRCFYDFPPKVRVPKAPRARAEKTPAPQKRRRMVSPSTEVYYSRKAQR